MGIKLCPLSLLTASPLPSKSILSCVSPPRPWLYLFWLSDATADVLSTSPFLFILTGLQWIPLPSLSFSVSPSLYLACLSWIWQGFTCCISFLYCPFCPSWQKKHAFFIPQICKCQAFVRCVFWRWLSCSVGVKGAPGPGTLMRSMLH